MNLVAALRKAFDPSTREIHFYVLAEGEDEYVIEEDPSGQFSAILPVWLSESVAAVESMKMRDVQIVDVPLSEFQFFKDPFVNEGFGVNVFDEESLSGGIAFDDLRDAIRDAIQPLLSPTGSESTQSIVVPRFWTDFIDKHSLVDQMIYLGRTQRIPSGIDRDFQILDVEGILFECEEGIPASYAIHHGYIPIGISISGDTIAIRRSGEVETSPVFVMSHEIFPTPRTSELEGVTLVLDNFDSISNYAKASD